MAHSGCPSRCCVKIPREFAPCYASVLLLGDNPDALRTAVSEIEAGPIRSSLTAWCSDCNRAYLLTQSLHLFPSPAAHHTHMVAWKTKFPVS